MQTQLDYQQRDEFDQEILTREISDRARPFLQLMHCAANGTPPANIMGKRIKSPRAQFAIWGELSDFAKAMNCSTKTVQRAIDDLLSLGILKKLPDEETNVLTYVLSLSHLIDVPLKNLKSPFGRAVALLSSSDIWESDNTVQPPVHRGVHRGVHPHDHDHEHEHEHDINKTHDRHEHAHDDHEFFESVGFESQESQFEEMSGKALAAGKSVPAASPKSATAAAHSVSFSAISDDHAKRIVRQFDGELFAAYFADAVNAGWARDCLDDRTRMAGLFHQVLRIGKAIIIGATIASAWKQRDNPGKRKGKPIALKLSGEDQDFAAKLVGGTKRSAVPATVKPLRTPLDGEDEGLCLSAAEIQRQKQIQRGNLAVLHNLQK